MVFVSQEQEVEGEVPGLRNWNQPFLPCYTMDYGSFVISLMDWICVNIQSYISDDELAPILPLTVVLSCQEGGIQAARDV